MAFLGIESGKMPGYYRWRRLAAALIDAVIAFLLSYLSYILFHKPDFAVVSAAFTSANGMAQGDAQTQAVLAAFSGFDSAYFLYCLIWGGYDVVTTFLLGGRTLGKLVMGLKIVPMNPKRNTALNYALLVVRAGVKVMTLFIFSTIPFLICGLTVLANREGRSGFDMFVRTKVIDTRAGRVKRPKIS